jgi:DegV family protein with EDD domain
VTVGIITDSAASLPADVAERAGVTVVRMRVAIGGTSYRDDQIGLEEVLRRVEEGVTTSGPAPGDILDAIEAHGGSDGTLVLTVARRVSSTHEAARLAAARLPHVGVLDTGTAAGAQGLVVLAAADRARAGAPLSEVEAVAKQVAARVRLVATLTSLDWLVRSGHVPEVAAWAGRSLGLRPVIEFRGGRVRPLRPTRGDAAAFNRVLAAWRASRPDGARLHVAALHALTEDGARSLLEAVSAEVEPATSFLGPFSSVMVTHTGPLLGLAWWWEEAPARER